MDDLAIGNDQFFRIIRVRQVVDQRLIDHFRRAAALLGDDGGDGAIGVVGHIVKRGHIYAGNLCNHAQVFRTRQAGRLPLPVGVDGLMRGHLAVAENKEIDKRRERFRIESAGATTDHEGAGIALLAPKRYASQIQRLEDVGKAHFILERNAEQIKLPHRRTALQRKQGHMFRAHERGHVHPRRKHALAPSVLARVDGMIEDLHAQMRHADLIGIREKKRIAHIDRFRVFHDAPELAAHVTHRLFNALQKRVDPF